MVEMKVEIMEVPLVAGMVAWMGYQ